MGDTQALRPDDSNVITDDDGRVVDRSLFEHSQRLERRLHQVREGVWCLVGNGLSNQTFVEGPDGIIAIDTGESIEEMDEALDELRSVTSTPVVAVIYTHFHYVNGTQAALTREPIREIWGHERITANLARSATEIGPAYGRGLVEQFAIRLPEDGPDAVVNVGLGLRYRMARHAPFTSGHVSPDHTFAEPCTITVAGLEIDVTPAPSDADDSVTLWFPQLKLAVHNLMWPALFNVFAIRGEEYRDPRVLLRGLDHLRSLGADHLVATHGPPVSNAVEIAQRLTRYRDSIQFMWDQTVRWTNRGATGPELADRIRLPDIYNDDWLTQQHYGVVEHHVRQIRNGLFGFFDGDEADLLPHEPSAHSHRMISALGGAERVRDLCRESLEIDPRWAIHLAALLARHEDATEDDRNLLAQALRVIARRTPSANLRNWCLTRALDLDGAIDMTRHREHRVGRRQAATWDLTTAVSILRVAVNPDLLDNVDVHLAVDTGGEIAGLHFRNHVGCPTEGSGATAVLRCERSTWDEILSGALALSDAESSGAVQLTGDAVGARAGLAAVELGGFAS